MSEQEPRKGDKVRAQTPPVEGIVESADSDGLVTLVTDDGRRIAVDSGCTVEVLERADDPFKNLEGTIRREDHEGGFSLWQSTLTAQLRSRWLCTYSTSYGNRGEYLDHDDVVGMAVVGAAPGTPAAEAQTPVAPCEPGPRPPLHPDNEAIVQGQYGTEKDVPLPERRMFRADGPEPPADVDNLEVLHIVGALNHKPYLRRGSIGWTYADDLNADVTNVIGFNWPASVDGTFREVV